MIAKWIIRTLAAKKDYDVTFAPKITAGKAGSGLHIHFKIMKGDQNMMTENGHLSDIAKKLSQESLSMQMPSQQWATKCRQATSASCLIRKPRLLFAGVTATALSSCACLSDGPATTTCVPKQIRSKPTKRQFARKKQTAELRSADCSADIYQLIAAMVVAARTGFEMENALQRAEDMYVSVNIHDDANKEKLAQLKSLPDSREASANALKEQAWCVRG